MKVASEAMAASKQPQRPWRSDLTLDLIQATSITLTSMCILPETAFLVASEAIATSTWPQRSLLISNLNSVTSITLVLFWPPNASLSQIFPDERGHISSIDLLALPQVKTRFLPHSDRFWRAPKIIPLSTKARHSGLFHGNNRRPSCG